MLGLEDALRAFKLIKIKFNDGVEGIPEYVKYKVKLIHSIVMYASEKPDSAYAL